ncbi:feather keratin Cos1-2-like [Manacus candei]|uniref:feather keratin Cos1-2-like n=1 Tax=Manacus candei TaxID=415023 RepID=UPI002225B867|nr:feather keratin Cos1-2-like [Manacus candei]
MLDHDFYSIFLFPPRPNKKCPLCPKTCPAQSCPCGPTPLANSCNECCVRQCQDSVVAIQPSPVVVTLPGPILSSFPQNTVVGSSTSAAVGSILSCDGVPINSGGFDLSCITSCYRGRCPPC